MARVLRAAVGGGLVAEPRCFGLLSHDVALLSAVADQTWSGHLNHAESNSLLHLMLGPRDTGRFLLDGWTGWDVVPFLWLVGEGEKWELVHVDGDKAGLWSRKDKGAIGGKRSEAKERQASRKAEMRVRRDRKWESQRWACESSWTPDAF